ncbi:GGDEF domain-containing protein [Alteromonas sp. C1M14]|uniref:GGDEF domain-containing protein n=1 Tax=Alteromonas sp. C1M14 TaxID=2841567 RepID=UPI001C0863DC|nr:GGDEF domain-containing protein [Alteromonas sp. C1M14]MBU2977562.1 GGDEF domain-containing protein [Alteromonas sp. C1M14]
MDVITIKMSTFVLSLVLTIWWMVLQRTNVNDQSLRNWAWVSFCFLGYGSVSLAGDVYFQNASTTLLASLFLIAAHAFVLNGLTTHFMAKKQHIISLICIGIAAFSHLLIPGNETASLAITYGLLISVDTLALIPLCHVKQPTQRQSYGVIMLALALSIFHNTFIVLLALSAGLADTLPMAWLPQYLALGNLIIITFILLSLFNMYMWKREQTLKTISRTDSLTHWLNGVALADYAQREFARCQRSNTSLAFITFDIDHFDQVYDNVGHLAGDKALKHVAKVAKEATREYDYHFRIGGETFIVMVTGLKISDFKGIAERIREGINQAPFYISTQAITLSVSVGIATLEHGDMNWQAIMERADRALYGAKKSGRNKTKLLTTHGLTLVKNE